MVNMSYSAVRSEAKLPESSLHYQAEQGRRLAGVAMRRPHGGNPGLT
jgi:hypothetical protein